VDVLLEIGGFIAGSNAYGTLLSFSLMSKSIRVEMEPTLYETVFVWKASDLAREPGTERWIAGYEHTK
jgi:hypothetical protein